MTSAEIDKVMEGVGEKIVLSDEDFANIVERLQSGAPGYPGLSWKDFLYVRDQIFNEPDAPVSYPFLWDISHSDMWPTTTLSQAERSTTVWQDWQRSI